MRAIVTHVMTIAPTIYSVCNMCECVTKRLSLVNEDDIQEYIYSLIVSLDFGDDAILL